MPNPTLQDSIHEWEAEEGQTDATMITAQLEVIAEELRTANLIAYLNTGPTSWGYHPGEGVLQHVQGQIEERLGLA